MQVAGCQLLFNAILALQQPVHRGIQLVGVRVRDPESGGQRGDVPAARGRQLALGFKDPSRDQGQHQLAGSRRARSQQTGKTEPAHREQHGLDVSVVQGGDHVEGLGGRHELVALEVQAQQFDRLRRQLGQVRQGAGLDPAVLAVAFSQQDGGGRASIGDPGNVHANHYYTL